MHAHVMHFVTCMAGNEGCNANQGVGFCAQQGWDPVTGLGTSCKRQSVHQMMVHCCRHARLCQDGPCRLAVGMHTTAAGTTPFEQQRNTS